MIHPEHRYSLDILYFDDSWDTFTFDARGVILDFGKFEGETALAPMLYNTVMSGDQGDVQEEESGILFSFWRVSRDLREELLIRASLQLAESTSWVSMWVSDDGFVRATELTQAEAEAEWRAFRSATPEDHLDSAEA